MSNIQIDSYYTADQNGTAATSNGSSALAVSGTSVTADWKIANTDWDNLSQGTHTIYVKAIDTSGNCTGCDGTKSLVIKKDTVLPTSKIKKVDDLVREPGFRPNFPTAGAYTAFLNANNGGDTKKTWWVQVEDADNVGGSGLNTCHISINGVEKPTRSCNGWTTFTVGKPNLIPRPDCTQEEFDVINPTCVVKVWATDSAENTDVGAERRIGVTSSELTTIEKDQRKYKDFNLHPQGFNVFNFGVDWTPPSAH